MAIRYSHPIHSSKTSKPTSLEFAEIANELKK
jgi:hypothetical protein